MELEILRPAEFESKHGRDPATVFDITTRKALRIHVLAPRRLSLSRLVSIYARTLEIDI